MSDLPDLAVLERLARAFAIQLEGAKIESVDRPFGASIYVRWESRGVRRAVEIQAARDVQPGVDVWATASKARKDRSLKFGSLAARPAPEDLEQTLRAAASWAEEWNVSDFF